VKPRQERESRRLALLGLALLASIAGFLAVLAWPEATKHPALRKSVVEAPAPPRERTWRTKGPVPGATLAEPVEHLPTPGRGPVPVYHPRDKDEWQGMLVNMSMRAMCEASEQCGLAAACINQLCSPCRTDGECAKGELCVLDHCLLAKNVSCRSRRDCSGEEVRCILSGYSSDPRNNAELLAACKEAAGGQAQPPDRIQAKGKPAPRPPVNTAELIGSVREFAKNGGLVPTDVP
jgi:hypothetical protein